VRRERRVRRRGSPETWRAGSRCTRSTAAGTCFPGRRRAEVGAAALRALDADAPDAAAFAAALGLRVADGSTLADTVYARVREKLAREPVEDYRIDFEDGTATVPTRRKTGTSSGSA